MILTNAQAIKTTLALLSHEDRSQRWFAARTLGGLARAKPNLQNDVIIALQACAKVDESREVREMATRSIREIRGDFDHSSEKYQPQEPVGNPKDQYYLKRG
ncbi:MAG TPA: HEAT repeat domain-containing protein [Candidatus Paceibacterota bacterium]